MNRRGNTMPLKRSLGGKFLLCVGSVVALTVLLLFVFIFLQSKQAIMDQVDQQKFKEGPYAIHLHKAR